MTRKAVIFLLAPLFASIAAAQELAPAPPMGWNSWDSFGLTITQDEFQANASYMALHLRKYGWEYAVVDEGWYLQNPDAKPGSFRFTMDANGRYAPAVNRFPTAGGDTGFRELANWVHAKNLKFGIHIIRGIPRQAVLSNLPIAGSQFRAADAANKSDTCAWNADNFGIKANAAGQAYYDSIAALYAGWGVDFVKIDCISRPYLDDEIHMFSQALRKTGRPIVLSLSPGPTPLEKAADVRKYAQMWRISDDFWDHWGTLPKLEWSQSLSGQFKRIADWAPHVEPGHWPDADMLPIGYLGPRPGEGQPRQTRFTNDEQRTLITLWCISRSPLMMGGNLTRLDNWTTSLLSNEELIAINQKSVSSRPVTLDDSKAVWVSKSEGNRIYVAVFNLSDSAQTIEYPLQSLGSASVSFTVHDLWARKNIGNTDRIKVTLQPHASAVYRLAAR